MAGAEAPVMTDPWSPDRRRAQRRSVPFLLQAQIDGTAEPMRVRELGPGGMVVQTGRPLALGTPVRVHVGTGAEAVGPLEGQVAHSRVLLAGRVGEPPDCRAGVVFTRVAPDQAAHLARLLSDIDRRRGRHSQDQS